MWKVHVFENTQNNKKQRSKINSLIYITNYLSRFVTLFLFYLTHLYATATITTSATRNTRNALYTITTDNYWLIN